MPRRYWTHVTVAILLALAALVIVRLHQAVGAPRAPDGASGGHRLAESWCKTCHAIEAGMAGTGNTAPDFAAIANLPSTTELSLKVFLASSHQNMPNLVLTREQTDDLVDYILSLKRR